MEFGIFSNGFRPHTTAAQTYEEDLREIVLADELGFRDAYISEHHGEPVYIDTVDTLPIPELLMCKAAALTKRDGTALAKVLGLHMDRTLERVGDMAELLRVMSAGVTGGAASDTACAAAQPQPAYA